MSKISKISNDLLAKSMKPRTDNKPRASTKSVFALVSLLLISVWANAQRIDSLKLLLPQSVGTNRCDLLYQIAYEFIDVDNELGLEFARQALNAAKSNCDSFRIVKAGRIKSLVFRRLGELDSSLVLSRQMLAIAERQHYVDEIEHILNGLALVYTHKANYDKALNCYFQALELGNKEESVWVVYHNIGMVYYKLEDYDKALGYYEQSLKAKKSLGSEDSNALVNISLCHAYKKDYSKAREFVNLAFSVCGIGCSSSFVMQAKFSLGLISFGLNDLSTAKGRFVESYNLARELSDERLQLDNIIYLSRVNIRQNNLKLAEKYLNDAERLVAHGTPYNLELIKLYNELFRLYERYKRFDRMAFYQNKYIQLKDSIYGKELTRNLMRVESKYLERENKAKLDTQAQILTLNEEIIFRQRTVNVFMGIMAVLLVILIFILFRYNLRNRTANLILEQKVKERTEELERNNDALIHTFEEKTVVFQKIATDVRSSMATIKGLCSLSLIDSEASYGSQYIRKIEATSDQLLNDVGRILSAKSMR